MIKLTVRELENLFFEEAMEIDGIRYEVIEQGSWIADHKYENCSLIFTDGERFYRGTVGRTNSGAWCECQWYSEWSGSDDSGVVEVHKVEKVVEVWEAVN